jgi:hypothetical protein
MAGIVVVGDVALGNGSAVTPIAPITPATPSAAPAAVTAPTVAVSILVLLVALAALLGYAVAALPRRWPGLRASIAAR